MKIFEKYSWLFSFCIALTVAGRFFRCPSIYIIAGVVLAAGLFIPVFLKLISNGWEKVTKAVGMIVSGIIFSVLFFMIITPLSFIKKLTRKKSNVKAGSNFILNEHVFSKEEFEKTW